MNQYEFESHLDREYLIETLVELLQVDCSVSLGPETLMDPDHPKLVHYVQDVIRPKLREIGVHSIRDMPKNQLMVDLGSGDRDETLLVMAYTPVQHYNWMENPLSGKIAVPDDPQIDEPCAFGQGASQNKAHFAAMLTLLKAFVDAGVELDGRLLFAANNEGRSSHACSRALLDELETKPDYGLILLGGGNDISVANRGRVDVLVHIDGKVTHSSTPEDGLNAIRGANEVINRLYEMDFTKQHPELGGQHAIPYQVVYDPVAPHTLPEYARIKVDRRMIPGDDPDEAVAEIEAAIGDLSPFDVEVEKDVVMLPSVVEPDATVVQGLQGAIESIDDQPADLTYGRGAFDAGGPTNMGVPTIMWGRPDNNTELMGDDYVTLRGVEEEARILGRMMVDRLA
ncbi:MAG: M20 family metallopeptidase [Halobacteriales archaeon]